MNNIIRVEHDKDNPYVIMNKGFFEDHNLSGKAKGILGYLLTKPDNWKVFISDLVNHFKDGETSIRAGLDELKKYNYMQRYPTYENKKISYWETVVYESPYPEIQRIKRKIISGESETYLLVENLEVGIRTQVINNSTKYRKKHKNNGTPSTGLHQQGRSFYYNGKRITKKEYQVHCISQLHDVGVM